MVTSGHIRRWKTLSLSNNDSVCLAACKTLDSEYPCVRDGSRRGRWPWFLQREGWRRRGSTSGRCRSWRGLHVHLEKRHSMEPSKEAEAQSPPSTNFDRRGTQSRQTCCPAEEEEPSRCCGNSCTESSASPSSGDSRCAAGDPRDDDSSVSKTAKSSQEPLRFTCNIIKHMSSASVSSASSKSTTPLDAPPRPHLDSSVPKLWYFNARGRAEIIRLIFAQAAVEYEDLRFREPPHAMDDFRHFKETHDLPFGQVPVLEIDGMLLAQSQAIVRYLSRKYNLMADDEVGNVRADMIFCGTEDLKQKFTTLLFSGGGSNLQETETLVECFVKETCPRWGNYFEKLLKQNGGVWMVGNHVTYADLSVYDMISSITWRLPRCFSQHPFLLEHSRRIEALPGIAAYLKRRPDVPI